MRDNNNEQEKKTKTRIMPAIVMGDRAFVMIRGECGVASTSWRIPTGKRLLSARLFSSPIAVPPQWTGAPVPTNGHLVCARNSARHSIQAAKLCLVIARRSAVPFLCSRRNPMQSAARNGSSAPMSASRSLFLWHERRTNERPFSLVCVCPSVCLPVALDWKPVGQSSRKKRAARRTAAIESGSSSEAPEARLRSQFAARARAILLSRHYYSCPIFPFTAPTR